MSLSGNLGNLMKVRQQNKRTTLPKSATFPEVHTSKELTMLITQHFRFFTPYRIQMIEKEDCSCATNSLAKGAELVLPSLCSSEAALPDYVPWTIYPHISFPSFLGN